MTAAERAELVDQECADRAALRSSAMMGRRRPCRSALLPASRAAANRSTACCGVPTAQCTRSSETAAVTGASHTRRKREYRASARYQARRRPHTATRSHGTTDEATRVRQGASTATEPAVLRELAVDPSATVRAALALNPAAPAHVNQSLARDTDERIRILLASQTGIAGTQPVGKPIRLGCIATPGQTLSELVRRRS